MADHHTESFDEFKNSFAYGSRSDLSFKLLKRLEPAEAAEFLRLVLLEIGELFDGAPPDRLVDLAYRWQVEAYTPRPEEQRPFTYDDHPFAPLTTVLSDITLGLVTSSGHSHQDRDPAPFGITGMTQDEATDRTDDFLRSTPELSAIPRDTAQDSLRVRHPGNDIRSVSRDPGVAFPRDLLVEAEEGGLIGRLANEMYSFVGACAQGRVRRVVPSWVDRWKTAGIEALLLVPVWPVCHVSVGHVAREAESQGIPTVTIVVRSFAHVAREMGLPRTVVTRHPMGRPLGPPGDLATQRRVIRTALQLLADATEGGAVVELERP